VAAKHDDWYENWLELARPKTTGPYSIRVVDVVGDRTLRFSHAGDLRQARAEFERAKDKYLQPGVEVWLHGRKRGGRRDEWVELEVAQGNGRRKRKLNSGRKKSKKEVVCKTCARRVAVKVDGTLRKHDYPFKWPREECPGSGRSTSSGIVW
jgi:hypothetical protein